MFGNKALVYAYTLKQLAVFKKCGSLQKTRKHIKDLLARHKSPPLVIVKQYHFLFQPSTLSLALLSCELVYVSGNWLLATHYLQQEAKVMTPISLFMLLFEYLMVAILSC